MLGRSVFQLCWGLSKSSLSVTCQYADHDASGADLLYSLFFCVLCLWLKCFLMIPNFEDFTFQDNWGNCIFCCKERRLYQWFCWPCYIQCFSNTSTHPTWVYLQVSSNPRNRLVYVPNGTCADEKCIVIYSLPLACFCRMVFFGRHSRHHLRTVLPISAQHGVQWRLRSSNSDFVFHFTLFLDYRIHGYYAQEFLNLDWLHLFIYKNMLEEKT